MLCRCPGYQRASLGGDSRCQGTWWKAHDVRMVVQGRKVHVGEEEEVRSEAGGREKLRGEGRVPESILYLPVSKAASDFCLESQSPMVILSDWRLQGACW